MHGVRWELACGVGPNVSIRSSLFCDILLPHASPWAKGIGVGVVVESPCNVGEISFVYGKVVARGAFEKRKVGDATPGAREMHRCGHVVVRRVHMCPRRSGGFSKTGRVVIVLWRLTRTCLHGFILWGMCVFHRRLPREGRCFRCSLRRIQLGWGDLCPWRRGFCGSML